MNSIPAAAFLLVKVNQNAKHVLSSIRMSQYIRWAATTYGPFQVIAYLEGENHEQLAEHIEQLRSQEGILEVDARMCKTIPGDEELKPFQVQKPEASVILLGVNYKEEKERVVTYHLRDVLGIRLARAMWGPSDIIVVAEADDHESMRNLICDQIKVMKGVASCTTLYCYPNSLNPSPAT
jgi:nitrate reductase NapAB chaperone NapD